MGTGQILGNGGRSDEAGVILKMGGYHEQVVAERAG